VSPVSFKIAGRSTANVVRCKNDKNEHNACPTQGSHIFHPSAAARSSKVVGTRAAALVEDIRLSPSFSVGPTVRFIFVHRCAAFSQPDGPPTPFSLNCLGNEGRMLSRFDAALENFV